MSGASAIQEGRVHLDDAAWARAHLPELALNQVKTRMAADRWEKFTPAELNGSTVGLVGYGSIGREVARLASTIQCQGVGCQKGCDASHG